MRNDAKYGHVTIYLVIKIVRLGLGFPYDNDIGYDKIGSNPQKIARKSF